MSLQEVHSSIQIYRCKSKEEFILFSCFVDNDLLPRKPLPSLLENEAFLLLNHTILHFPPKRQFEYDRGLAENLPPIQRKQCSI